MDSQDDWETDPDYVNDVSEMSQRWGTQERSVGAIDMNKLREETTKADSDKKKKLIEEEDIAGTHGYGGKFGVQTDRKDKCAMGHDYIGKVEKHGSQKDYSEGFGGKFGIQKDRMDKSAVGHDYVGKVEKHASQKDYSDGFGGKFGVQKDRMDKSAVGHDYKEKVEKHGSQTDHKKGFGGVFGVEKDRMDKSAVGFTDASKVGTNYIKTKPDISGAKPSNLRAKFENMAMQSEEDARIKAEQQKRIREEKDRMDKESATLEQTNAMNNKIPDVISVNNSNEKPKEIKPVKIADAFKGVQQVQAEPVPKKVEKIVLPKMLVEEKKDEVDIIQKKPLVIESPPIVIESSSTVIESLPVIENPISVVEEKLEPAVVAPVPEIVSQVEIAQAVENQSSNIYMNQQELLEEQSKLEETLVEQLKNDNIPVEATAEEQFILSAEDPGITATAMYDYQAAADDEISFDPNDLISHIEMIDNGWWRGLHQKTNNYGLFPANYVQLNE